MRPTGAVRSLLPLKADLDGLVGGRLVVKLNQDWSFGGKTYPAGALVAATPGRPGQPLGAAELIFAPGPRQSVEEVTVTKARVLAAVLDNVRGRASASPAAASGWSSTTAAPARQRGCRPRLGQRDRRAGLHQRHRLPAPPPPCRWPTCRPASSPR